MDHAHGTSQTPHGMDICGIYCSGFLVGGIVESCWILLVVAGRFAVILLMFSSGFKRTTNF